MEFYDRTIYDFYVECQCGCKGFIESEELIMRPYPICPRCGGLMIAWRLEHPVKKAFIPIMKGGEK